MYGLHITRKDLNLVGPVDFTQLFVTFPHSNATSAGLVHPMVPVPCWSWLTEFYQSSFLGHPVYRFLGGFQLYVLFGYPSSICNTWPYHFNSFISILPLIVYTPSILLISSCTLSSLTVYHFSYSLFPLRVIYSFPPVTIHISYPKLAAVSTVILLTQTCGSHYFEFKHETTFFP